MMEESLKEPEKAYQKTLSKFSRYSHRIYVVTGKCYIICSLCRLLSDDESVKTVQSTEGDQEGSDLPSTIPEEVYMCVYYIIITSL